MAEITVSVELPHVYGFLPGTPLALAGRVFAPLRGEIWNAAMGEFLLNHVALSLPEGEENRTRYAIRLGLQHGASLLPKEAQEAAEAEMMNNLDRLLPSVKPKARWRFKR